jgi:hypothetical protein
LFLNIFSSVLLPLVIVAGLGFALGRLRGLDPRPLADAAFYVFNPSLAFITLSTSTIQPAMLGRLVLLKLVATIFTVILATLGARSLRLSAPAASALIMAASFSNSGNFGLPASEYAFGEAGLAFAVICYIADNLVMNSFGVFVAARGHVSARRAFVKVLENPAVLAVPLALLANQSGWIAPLWLERALKLLSQAAVPVMITLLGVQLARIDVTRRHTAAIGLASALKLVVMPAIAYAASRPLGLSGLALKVGLLQTAVPTAVMPTILATRFESEPSLVASTVLATSLFSLFTLTALLLMMG